MHIVFVNATRRFGGVKAWTLDVMTGLSALGHRTTLFARPGPFLDKALARGLNARTGWFGFDYHPVSVPRYLHFFKKEQVDVVVCNVGKDLRIAGVAARLAGVPVVHRVGLPRDMRDTLKVRNTHTFTRAHLLAPCADIRDGLAREVSFIKATDVQVIPTGKVPAKAAPGTANIPRTIAVTSQLNPDKGHADLFQALAELARQGRDFKLIVAGTGKSEGELKTLADQLGIAPRIEWTGFVTDVQSVLKRADIFALPSLSEGLPNTLLEAMAQGLVPVARNVGGIGEAWPHETPPLDETLVHGQGHAGLKDALDTLLALPDTDILDLKEQVWTWFATHHSLQKRVGELELWLKELTTR